MDNNAVAPSHNPVVQIYGNMKKEQDKTFDSLREKDEEWKQFGNSSFYYLVKEYIESLMNAMDELEGQAFDNGASLEEIGLRRAVNRLTKANLHSLIKKVEGTRDTRSNPGGAKEGPAVS